MCEGMDHSVKSFKVLGAVFIVFGIFFTLMGALSAVFPLIDNDQVKMILNSFETASTDTLTNTLNSIIIFCLRSSYFLLFCGISLMVAGGLITSSAQKTKSIAEEEPEYRIQNDSITAPESPGDPKPAYYPGGMAPAYNEFETVNAQKASLLDEEPAMRGFDEIFSKPSGPISGAIEPVAFSEESEAQRLMQNDRQMREYQENKPEPKPEYTEYISNSPAEYTEEQPSAVKVPSPEPGRVKIVSTMGKRRY